MKKYAYGLIGLGAVSVAALAYVASGSMTKPDEGIVKNDLKKDIVEMEVQARGWLAVDAQGKLADPSYRSRLSDDLSAMNAKIAVYQQLLAEAGR